MDDRKLLAILVVYDLTRAILAKGNLFLVLKSLNVKYNLLVISNNQKVLEELSGSNIFGEFSGWDEALSTVNIAQFSHFLFVNDTFYEDGRFGPSEVLDLRNILSLNGSQCFIWGEVSYFTNIKRLAIFKMWIHKWVRTSFFLMDRLALFKLKSLTPLEFNLTVDFKSRSISSVTMPDNATSLIIERVQAWIFPSISESGWSRLSSASNERIRLKAYCVYAELMLSHRCTKSGISIISTSNRRTIRYSILDLAYRFQCIVSTPFRRLRFILTILGFGGAQK